MPSHVFLREKALEAMTAGMLPGLQVHSALVMPQGPAIGKVFSTELTQVAVDLPHEARFLISVDLQSFLVPLPWSACPGQNETSVENYRECQVWVGSTVVILTQYISKLAGPTGLSTL